MERLICDTMIWYNLAKKKLRLPDPNQYTLVCTYLTLMELAYSPNNLNKLEEVQEAIKAIIEIKPQFVMHSPLDYARALIDDEYNPKYSEENDLTLSFLRVLLSHPKDGLINNSFKSHLIKISSIRKHNMEDWATFLNKLFDSSGEFTWVLKKYINEESYANNCKNWLILELNELEQNTYSIDKVDWSLFEFYIGIGTRYMRTLQLSRMKADRNDENDLKNMIYVQPNDKYWTLEKRWISIVKEAQLNHYLYVQPH